MPFPFYPLPRVARVLAASMLGITFSGCAAFHPGESDPAPSPESRPHLFVPENTRSGEVQQEVMDIADSYMAATWQALDDYIAQEPDLKKRALAEQWRVRYSAAAMTIAASKDPRTNLLDMAVFLSVGHWAVKNYWVPQVFGEKAAGLSLAYAKSEDAIWTEVARSLSPGHRDDLRNLITTWEANDHPPYEVADVRLRNLDGVNLKHFQEAATARGLLASVKSLLGSVDNSLLYGERVMFYLERTPRILNQQVNLTLSQISLMAPVASLSGNVDKLAGIVQGLPEQIGDGFNQNQQLLRDILPQVHDTVDSANTLVRSLNETVTNLRALSAESPVKGIDPKDVAPALQQATATLAHLDSVVGGIDRLLTPEAGSPTGSSKAEKLSAELQLGTDAIVDKLFQRVLAVLGILFAGIVVLLVIARLLFRPRVIAVEKNSA